MFAIEIETWRCEESRKSEKRRLPLYFICVGDMSEVSREKRSKRKKRKKQQSFLCLHGGAAVVYCVRSEISEKASDLHSWLDPFRVRALSLSVATSSARKGMMHAIKNDPSLEFISVVLFTLA